MNMPRIITLVALALLASGVSGGRGATGDEEAIPSKVETAVDSGLEYLAKTQQHDGSWSAGGAGSGSAAAATGLAAMAFMARGHVPGQGPYGENINRAVDAVLTMQGADGVFTSGTRPMYEHGICTVSLCEAYGMLDDARQAKARTAIGKGIRVILNAQAIHRPNPDDQGGWRYEPDTTQSDLSVSGWQLMALRGASNAGANVPEKALKDGIDYVKRRAIFGGGFAYQGQNGVTAALTGTGVLALSLLGQSTAPEVKAGGDYLLHADITRNPRFYYYTMYYCSQAAWQLGGNYWTILNREISEDLLKRRKPDGSWTGGESGDAYCTAMAILALTVPYRYLPIYQR